MPNEKAQRSFTDAGSRIMPGPGGKDFQQVYNCQAVVDAVHQVIVAARATNLTSDKRQAVSLLEETIGKTGAAPMEVSADAGYYSAKAVDGLHTLSVDPYVAPERTRHGRVPSPAPRGRMPSHLPPGDWMRRNLQNKRGRGFRQSLLRGLEKVNREWLRICTGHNLLKLFRSGAPRDGKRAASQQGCLLRP